MSFGISKGGSENSTSNMSELVNQLFNQFTSSTNTGTSTGTTTNSGGSQGTSAGSRERSLTPYQQQVQPQLFKIMQAMATDPKSFLAPAQNAGREDVNANYSRASDMIRQQFMSNATGNGGGKQGKAAVMSDLARRGDLSKVDNSFAQQAAQMPVTAAQLMQQFLGMDFGEKTSGVTSGTNTGVSTSTGSTTDTGTVSTTGGSTSTREVDQRGRTTRGVGFNVGI